MSGLVFPVYEIRPPDGFFRGDVFRYAEGKWSPDDGEWDLAFAGLSGTPICLYVDLPDHENIIWSWTTGHWSGYEPQHPRGNAWHYMLRDGANDWGESWGKGFHPNSIAGRSGMDFVYRTAGCANGIHAEFRKDNPIIWAGLMRNMITKEIVVEPTEPVCMYGCFRQ